MIRITIELLPQGKEELKRCLGVAVITNDFVKSLTSNGARGDYNVKLSKFGGRGMWKKGRVEGFDREKRGPWDLLFLALRNIVGDRNKETKGGE